MPTYEYKCTKCGHAFEKFQSMSAAPVRTCPECKGKVRRLIGKGAGIIFKGSGFYCTDYRGKSPTGKDAAEPKSESTGAAPAPAAAAKDAAPSTTKGE